MKHTLFILLTAFSVITAFGQGSDDARIFSQSFYQGTAKSMALGGAMGAIGADMTAICINPAGMGVYRSNELAMSMGLADNTSQSTYYGNKESLQSKAIVNIPNIGYVSTKEKSNYGKLRFTQFGISLNRTNDYNSIAFASGFNPNSSLMDNYLGQIPQDYNPDYFRDDFPYTLYPAWEAMLLDIFNDTLSSPVPQGNIQQEQTKSFKGRSEEWTFAFSANYSERFFIGASLGLDHIKRTGTKIHTEYTTEASPETSFQELEFTENITSNAWGVNLKLGAIYYLTTWMRIGASYHTPTLFSFDESWKTITEAYYTSDNYYNNYYYKPSLISEYNYDFLSPQKFIGSLAFIINHRGLISIDADVMNYRRAKFDCKDFDYSFVNQEIKDIYKTTLNFRLGTEWQYKNVYFRGGCAYYGSPFGFGEMDNSVKKASCGLGIQLNEGVLFDLAYEFSHGKQQYVLYAYDDIEPVCQTLNRHAFVATMKVKF